VTPDQRAIGLQSIYHAGRAEALAPLREVCQAIAAGIVRGERRRRGLYLAVERIEEIASDAAGQLVAYYLRNPGYNVRSFRRRLAYEVCLIMNAGARSKQRHFEDHLHTIGDPDRHSDCLEARERVAPAAALDALVAEHPKGKKIAADLYRSLYYRVAIRRIAAYVDRRWIYEHAEALHQVFRTFHWRPTPRGGQGQPAARAGGLRQALRRGKQDERVESHRGADKVAER
jgi:hypothetical protein